ncbi:MAG: SH3 domain-containing protein [Chloroflexi bacterium]|nr:SH3 domain-containing protein [Chloroflexota bacterium]
MTSSLRLQTLTLDDSHVQLIAHFPAPAGETEDACAELRIDWGDGNEEDAGALCAPTHITWRSDHRLTLGEHAYQQEGPFTIKVAWGEDVALQVEYPAPETERPEVQRPELIRFDIESRADDPTEVTLHIGCRGLSGDHQLRIDAGAGKVFWLRGRDGSEQEAVWTLSYGKAAEYVIGVDWLDEEGFFIDALDEKTLEIPAPHPPPIVSDEVEFVAQDAFPPPEPWLPFHYARPVWSWMRTYRRPGGAVAHTVAPGTYLAIAERAETNGQTWYRSRSFGWFRAGDVALIRPSRFRGVELKSEPEEPTPPEPGETRRGVVTANVLNVRARPGVRADNPPIDRLYKNAQVTIYEESSYAGAIWYRIGENRWVHSGWVRLLSDGPSQEIRRGVVTANVLNVRARPGVRADNPPIDRLYKNTRVDIYEESPYAGAIWYRIGEGRWVHSGWIRLLASRRASELNAQAEEVRFPIGWVISQQLNVRAQPGVSDDNPPIDVLGHYARVAILETVQVKGKPWHRIGDERWVYGPAVRVAEPVARPLRIPLSAYWVGVNLRQQILIAYEGDRPVYATLVSSGLPGTPTVRGIFRTWWRLRSRKMSGGKPGSPGYYYLDEVTWTCYFYAGYALHTAYWHDDFGRPRSHGCVNLAPYDAWWLFNWSAPGGRRSPMVYVYSR